MALGSFAVGMEGFMIGGLLPTLADALHVTLAVAGQLVTVFSLVYAVASPLLTSLTGAMERRKLMFASLALVAVGNVLCGFASSYGLMLAGRIIAALGASIFSPTAVAVASAVSAPEKRGRALSTVISGQTVSLILGVPFGTWIALTFDWRATFWIVGGVALVAAIVIRLLFPAVPAAGSIGLKERLSPLKRPELLSSLMITMVWAIGIFSLFTYVSDLFAGYGAGGRAISFVLFFSGVASFIGVRAGGVAADRIGSARAIPIALSMLTLALALLAALFGLAGRPGVLAAAVASLALYSLSGYMFNPALQHRLIGLAGPSAGLALSLNASAIYLGSALGASTGGLVIRFDSVGHLGYFSGAMTALALGVFAASRRLERRSKSRSKAQERTLSAEGSAAPIGTIDKIG
nr:MFS transporter [Cohnella zeiphila]